MTAHERIAALLDWAGGWVLVPILAGFAAAAASSRAAVWFGGMVLGGITVVVLLAVDVPALDAVPAGGLLMAMWHLVGWLFTSGR